MLALISSHGCPNSHRMLAKQLQQNTSAMEGAAWIGEALDKIEPECLEIKEAMLQPDAPVVLLRDRLKSLGKKHNLVYESRNAFVVSHILFFLLFILFT